MLTVYWHGKRWKHRTLLAAGRRLRGLEPLYNGRQARCEDEKGFDLTPEAWDASDAKRKESEMNEPTKGPYKYDGQVYIFGPDGEMIAEVRGAGAGLPQDANGLVLAASWDLLDVCEFLAERITDCRECDGTGEDPHAPGDACRNCGGVGEVMDGTPELGTVRDAIAKARGKDVESK